jgi:hypothetical protein
MDLHKAAASLVETVLEERSFGPQR